jgi:hypothetical protein
VTIVGKPRRSHTTMYRQAADILYSVLVRVMYKDTVLKGCYTDHQQTAAYWSQLKARTQLGSKLP